MRHRLVPARAVLVGGAATVLWIGGILLTHASGAASMIEALNTVEDVSLWLLTAGIPGGLVTGVVADEYAPLMKEGFLASVGGAAAVVVALSAYGIGLSLLWGYGVDSVLSFMFTGPTMFTFFLLMPLLAMEGVVFAVVGNAVWGRLGMQMAV